MPRLAVAVRKVPRTISRLDQAEALLDGALGMDLSEVKRRDLVSFYFMVAAQEVLDLTAHWVAEAGWPIPSKASSAFDLLVERGAIDRDLATRLCSAEKLRSQILMGYAKLDPARLEPEFRQGAAAMRSFLGAVSTAAEL